MRSSDLGSKKGNGWNKGLSFFGFLGTRVSARTGVVFSKGARMRVSTLKLQFSSGKWWTAPSGFGIERPTQAKVFILGPR